MVQILERPESTSERFARALYQGGSAFPEAMSNYYQSKSKEQQKSSKHLNSASKDVDSYLKNYEQNIHAVPSRKREVLDNYLNILNSDPEIDKNTAMRMSVDQYRGNKKEVSAQKQFAQEFSSRTERQSETDEEKQFRQHLGRYTPEERAQLKNPWGLASAAKRNPREALSEIAAQFSAGTVDIPFTSFQRTPEQNKNLSEEIKNRIGLDFKFRDAPKREGLSGLIREKGGVNALDQETQKELGILGAVANLIGPSAISKLRKPGAPSSGARPIEALAPAEKAASEFSPFAKELQKETSLAGRVSQKAPSPVTEARVSRLAPESKIYKRGEHEQILRQQLKDFPKYAQEISADAAERSARLNKVLGEKALASKDSRMTFARTQLPKAQESYQNAIARVRALEEEVAKFPKEQRTQALLKAATQELEESEFYLRQMLNNVKTGEARVGLDTMKKAAQEKILAIGDDVAEGKEIVLKGADYSPRLIQEAKKISSRKPLRSARTDDFYTQVHDAYANEYRKRLAEVTQEIKAPIRGLGEAEGRMALRKEKEALEKMIQSAEAENTIHRHKIALREMNQRKMAQERLARFEKQSAPPKVQGVAQSRLQMQERVGEALKSPEGRAKLAEEVAVEAEREAKTPLQKQKIKEESRSLKDAFDEVNAKTEELKSGAKVPPKSAKEAAQKGWKIVRDWEELKGAWEKGFPELLKTRIGKDVTYGVGVQLLTEVLKENDIDVPQGALISAVAGGSSGGVRGAGYRYFLGWLTRKLISKYKKEKYKDAVLADDEMKAQELRKKYPKKIIKQAQEEIYQQETM